MCCGWIVLQSGCAFEMYSERKTALRIHQNSGFLTAHTFATLIRLKSIDPSFLHQHTPQM